MASVFVSYSRVSQPVVQALVEDIEALGHDVWFDQELSGGQNWWDQILDKIRGCDVFIFAVAPDALESTACKREADYADNLGKPVLPILVDDGVSTSLLPAALSRIQFVDYRKQDRDAALSLGRAFSSLPPAKPLPEPLPIPPDAPISYLATLAERVGAAASLDYDGQSSLVIDLKRGLRDPETADDSRTLLERLRKRDDLYAKIADEIDEIVKTQNKPVLTESAGVFVHKTEENAAVSAFGSGVGSQESDRVKRDIKAAVGLAGATQKKPSSIQKCAMPGGGLGLVVGILAFAYNAVSADEWIFVLIPAAGGAIASAISRESRIPILLSLSGAALAFVTAAVFFSLNAAQGVVFGATAGAILGAIVGFLVQKRLEATALVE